MDFWACISCITRLGFKTILHTIHLQTESTKDPIKQWNSKLYLKNLALLEKADSYSLLKQGIKENLKENQYTQVYITSNFFLLHVF